MPFNQFIAHAETNLFRAVTGGAYRLRGAYGFIVYGTNFPRVGTIPLSTPVPGTIISQGVNVRGTSTFFLRDVREGYYIHAKNVVRKVMHVISDTLLVLEGGFPTDIASPGEGLRICRPQAYNSVYAKSTGDADPTLQEAPFRENDTHFDGGAPFSYDATTGEISFEVTE
jgi:hypothetical protein